MKAKFDFIERRLSQLEKSRSGIGSGWDDEFFDEPIRLEKVEQVLGALLQVLEGFHPDVRGKVSHRYQEMRFKSDKLGNPADLLLTDNPD